MALYLVGDIHGCQHQLLKGLAEIGFNRGQDELWCVGDLVGRGPDALGTLQHLASLGDSFQCTLGNHDLHCLAVLTGQQSYHPAESANALLADAAYWQEWLRQFPLLLEAPEHQLLVTHAGCYPWWSLTELRNSAREAEAMLQGPELADFLPVMYGNEPARWSPALTGADRLRFIVNAFTRMRYCFADGQLELNWKAPPEEERPAELEPWFHYWHNPPGRLVFGHWASLAGRTQRTDIVGLDTGCVWGEQLTFWQPATDEYLSVPATLK